MCRYQFLLGKSNHYTDINQKVKTDSKTILNIFNNLIPHKTIKLDDKDPPWMTKKIKKKLYTVKKKLLKKLNSLQGRRNSIHIISKKRLLFQSKKKIM